MQPKFVEHPAFHVVGLSMRPSNADEMAGKGRIGAIWERFYAEDLVQKIPNQTEPGVVLALYTEYQEDVNAPYSFPVGVKVHDVADPPARTYRLLHPRDEVRGVHVR